MDRLGIKFTSLCRRDNNLDKSRAMLENASDETKIELVNYKDRGGSTPLMAAVWDGAKATCEFLLENGANANLQNLKGNTALHFAYECSKPELVDLLKEKGADEARKNYVGKVPSDLKDKRIQDIQRAKEAEPVIMAQVEPTVLTKRKGSSNASDVMLPPQLLRACKDGDLTMAVKIVEDEAQRMGLTVKEYVNRSNSKGSTGLMSASWQGRLDVAALYIELGADVKAVNRKRNTAMHFALERLNYEVAAYLKMNGAKECLGWRNRLGYTPVDLKHQSENKHVERRSAPKMAAVERANKVREDIQVELFRACRRGDIKKLEDVVQEWEKEMRYAGMGVLDLLNHPDKNLSTPLILAVFHNKEEIVRYLIQKGVSLSAANNIGNTSLHIAYARGYSAIAKILLEKGADSTITNDKGETPEEAALSAMQEKQAKLERELEAKKATEIFVEPSKEEPQPRRPSTDKPNATRPLPGQVPAEPSKAETCLPQQKLELAQALDKQFSASQAQSMESIASIEPPKEVGELEHVENVFADNGTVWEVFEDPEYGSALYHNPSEGTWYRESDVWRPCQTPVDSFGVHIDYWHNMVTGETSWKMPRVLLPKKILVLMPNSKARPTSPKGEQGADGSFKRKSTRLSASIFQAMAIGMGLNDVLEQAENSLTDEQQTEEPVNESQETSAV